MLNLRIVFAHNLRKTRIKLHISQEKLAELVGISIGYVSELEHSNRFPSDEVLTRIADALGVKVFQLLMPEDMAQEYSNLLEQQALFETWAEKLIQTVSNHLKSN